MAQLVDVLFVSSFVEQMHWGVVPMKLEADYAVVVTFPEFQGKSE